MVFGECAGNLRQRGGDLVRLGGENQNIGKLGRVGIGGDHGRAGFGIEMLLRGGDGVGGADFPRKNNFRAHKTLGQRRGHLARAEKTDF